MDIYRKIITLLFLLLLSNTHLFAQSTEGFEIVAGDETLCSKFSNYINYFMRHSSIKEDSVTRFSGIRHEAGAVKLPNGELHTPYLLDINNDGKDEVYFEYNGGGRYILGTILYVINNPENLSSDLSNIQMSDLQVLPCQYDEKPYISSDCPTFSQEADGAGALVSIGEESTFFRGRYTDIRMIQHEDINYLLFRAVSGGSINNAAIVKPFDVSSYESVCILKR